MLAVSSDGTIGEYEEHGEGDSPWLQVWSFSDGELLYTTPAARRNPVPGADKLAAEAQGEDKIVRVPNADPPYRVFTGGSRIGGKPVIGQFARTRAPRTQDI